MESQAGSRGMAVLFLNLGARLGSVFNATPWPLYSRERDPIPIVQEAGWTRGRVWTAAEHLAYIGSRSLDSRALSELLYRTRGGGDDGDDDDDSDVCNF